MTVDAHFPKCAKLLKPAEFKQVFDASQRVSNKHITIFYRENDLPHARLGLAISKKVSKLAVQRNRLKRLSRESFRLQRSQLPEVDCVIIARASAVQVDNSELVAGLKQLWKKIRKKVSNVQ